MIFLQPKISGTMLTKRGIAEVSRICNRITALSARENLPAHFAPNAQQKYKYKQRSKKYQADKRSKFGHTTPLVYTGELKWAVLSSARITATPKRGVVYGRGSRRSQLRAQLKKEVEAVTEKEKTELRQGWANTFTELASLSRYQKKINRG